jgi:hypothetical protein
MRPSSAGQPFFRSLAIATAVCLTIGGCSVLNRNPKETKAPPGRRVNPLQLKSSISFEGALNEQVDYGFSYASVDIKTCEAVAGRKSESATSAVSYVLPMPTRIGSQHLMWTAAIRPYDGPREYDLSKIPGFQVEIRRGNAKAPDRFVKSSDTQASATVKRDGAGTFTFRRLHNGSQTLSGALHWTCSDSG